MARATAIRDALKRAAVRDNPAARELAFRLAESERNKQQAPRRSRRRPAARRMP